MQCPICLNEIVYDDDFPEAYFDLKNETEVCQKCGETLSSEQVKIKNRLFSRIMGGSPDMIKAISTK